MFISKPLEKISLRESDSKDSLFLSLAKEYGKKKEDYNRMLFRAISTHSLANRIAVTAASSQSIWSWLRTVAQCYILWMPIDFPFLSKN